MIRLTADRHFIMGRRFVGMFALAMCCFCLAGCGTGGNPATVREGHLIMVFCDDKPIGGVEVRLFNVPYAEGDKPAYAGFSDTSGAAYLTPAGEAPPAIDTTQWKAAVLSDGDGSWMIDPKFNDPAKAGIDLQFDAAAASGDSVPSIRLPGSAIRPLTH